MFGTALTNNKFHTIIDIMLETYDLHALRAN